jgi:TPR repeat protein
MVHREWSASVFPPTCLPGQGGAPIGRMRLFQATKREGNMRERTYLFLMNMEQAAAFARLTEAASRGDGDAACQLGDMYHEGAGGLRYSPKETQRWYARSAMTGYSNGQNNLGACYEHGLGCAQSYAKAVKWYRLAAAQLLGTASMNLGYCHLRGHGVPADKGEALRLFRMAVEHPAGTLGRAGVRGTAGVGGRDLPRLVRET